MHFTEEILKELPYAVTVCDKEAKIIYMNERSLDTFRKNDNENMIGRSLFDCHNPHSAAKIREMLETGGTNSYTIDKNGVKKLIYQSPWYKNGKIEGLVEISMIIPDEMPHYIR